VKGKNLVLKARVIESPVEAIESGGSTLRDYVRSDGETGYFQHKFDVYGKKGKPFPVCKTKIEQILGWTIPTRHYEPRPGDVRRHLADITLLKNLTEFEPQVSIDEGLTRTVEFYRRQANHSPTGGR